MFTNIRNSICCLSLCLVSQLSMAQTMGLGMTTGSYKPTFTNANGQIENVQGRGTYGLQAFAEFPFANSKNLIVPVSIGYNHFASEHILNDLNSMKSSAENLVLDLGIKYSFKTNNDNIKPFVKTSLGYELMVNSSYYYNETQQGTLGWKPNLYGNLTAGLRFNHPKNILEIFGKVDQGFNNRLSNNAKYTDQFISFGINIIKK